MVSFVFCSFAFKIVNENEMKRKFYIFGVLAALCLLGTGYYAWTLYNAHCKQMAEWNEGAKAAFEEALWMEVNKRADIPIPYYSGETKDLKTLNESIPDTIYVTSSFGRRGYYIDRVRRERSLIKDLDKSIMLGGLLYKYPLSVDTLAKHWNIGLSERKIPAKSKIRYVFTDWDLKNDTVCSVANNQIHFDSLSVSYLGIRCEHEVTAYISYPHWLSSFSWQNGCVYLVPWLLLVVLYIFYPHLETFVRRKLVREKNMEVGKKDVVEKKARLVNVKMEKAQAFEFPDGTIFNAFECTIERDGLQQRLQPQSVSLLKLFLSTSDYKVTSDEICVKLWGDAQYSYRLHSAITRLRNDLKAVKSELVVSCSYGVYELKSPISSNISNPN